MTEPKPEVSLDELAHQLHALTTVLGRNYEKRLSRLEDTVLPT